MNFFSDHLAFFDLLGKGLAVLVLGFAFQFVRPRASAGQRSLAWLPAFVVLALLPGTLLVNPWWAWSITQAQPLPPALPMRPVPFVADTAPVIQAPPSPSWWQSLDGMNVALAAWAAGACTILAFRLIGEWQLRRLRKVSPVCAERRVHHHLEWLAEELGVRQAIDLRQSARISVPLTWGWLKPVLLLPVDAATWDDEKLDAALRHELGHMRHHDACNRWLATLVCALWWPLPLAWMAARAWRLEQEKACDDLVLRAGAPAQDYAMQLLAAARAFSPGIGAAMAMARPSTLETRLRAVMDEQRNRRPMNSGTWLRAGGSALALSGLSMLAQLRAASNEPVIAIETQVIEAPKGTLTALIKKTPDAEGTIVMGAQEWAAVKEAMARTPEADIVSTPTVTTMRGKSATIQVGDGKTPLRSEGKGLPMQGLRLTVEPQIKSNGLHLNLALLLTLPGAHPGEFTESLTKASTFLKDGAVLAFTDSKVKAPGREMFCFVVPKIIPDAQPVSHPGDAPAAVQTKAAQIILDRLEFRDASLDEALGYLRMKSRDLDPARKGVNIVSTDAGPDSHITLNLENIPLSEALMYCAQLANRTVTFQQDAVVVHPPGRLGADLKQAVESPVMTQAKAIVLPRVELAEATLAEGVEFLRARSRDLDPQHRSLNIIIKPGADHGQLITLSLLSVPASEALIYMATLADVKLEADAHALLLSPK